MRSLAVEKENDKLRIAHGSTGGQANYKWQWSDDLTFPLRDESAGWDYVADPKTGIIAAYPVFTQRPMCPTLHGQWVVCRFLAPPTETEWKNQFGPKVEYPVKGYYAPTNLVLDPGLRPWDCSPDGTTFTDALISIAFKDRAKKLADWDREGKEIVERREAAEDQARNDKIDEMLYTPFGVDHIEGKRGGSVSIGGVGPGSVAPGTDSAGA